MTGALSQIDNQDGAVFIVVVVLLLAILVVGGMTILTAVVSETRIAANWQLHKMAFYEAEGGVQIGTQLIADNIYHKGRRDGEIVQGIVIDDGDFYMSASLPVDQAPGQDNQVAHFPNPGAHPPVTRIMIGGVTSLSTGSGIQMLNGYASAGKTVARGGGWVTYNIRSRHVGRRKSESIVDLFYRHVF